MIFAQRVYWWQWLLPDELIIMWALCIYHRACVWYLPGGWLDRPVVGVTITLVPKEAA